VTVLIWLTCIKIPGNEILLKIIKKNIICKILYMNLEQTSPPRKVIPPQLYNFHNIFYIIFHTDFNNYQIFGSEKFIKVEL